MNRSLERPLDLEPPESYPCSKSLGMRTSSIRRTWRSQRRRRLLRNVSLLLSNVCYPNFTGVKECAQDADSVRLHFGVLFLVLVCFARAESSAKKASLMETCLTLVWERARSPA